ncbi:MAG: hypothetical protein NTX58_13815 [Actinobacteria bacterium]|nr:hypothetical protein [Actinomycetota bacterium]
MVIDLSPNGCLQQIAANRFSTPQNVIAILLQGFVRPSSLAAGNGILAYRWRFAHHGADSMRADDRGFKAIMATGFWHIDGDLHITALIRCAPTTGASKRSQLASYARRKDIDGCEKEPARKDKMGDRNQQPQIRTQERAISKSRDGHIQRIEAGQWQHEEQEMQRDNVRAFEGTRGTYPYEQLHRCKCCWDQACRTEDTHAHTENREHGSRRRASAG